jgi:spore coat polysaccharide biosynthesis predicted glycosyltransferase SpsG
MARIAFATRGGAGSGLGHLHRVSWLLETLSGAGVDGLALLVCCADSPEARAFAWPRGQPVQFCAAPLAAIAAACPDVAVVDWLDSLPQQVAELARLGIDVVLLDDYGAAQEYADIVVNALLAPLEAAEAPVGRARVLSGAPYVQFPPSVVKLRGTAEATARAMEVQLTGPLKRLLPGGEQDRAQSVLISFGGAPVADAVALALRALSLERFEGKVLVIPAPAPGARPSLPAPGAPGALDVDWLPAGPELHSLLSSVDLAILAGGLTLYEAAFLGVAAVCVALNEHQAATARKLEAAGACRFVGMLAGLSPEELAPELRTLIRAGELRRRMSSRGAALFDGRGLQRTVEAILGLLR